MKSKADVQMQEPAILTECTTDYWID